MEDSHARCDKDLVSILCTRKIHALCKLVRNMRVRTCCAKDCEGLHTQQLVRNMREHTCCAKECKGLHNTAYQMEECAQCADEQHTPLQRSPPLKERGKPSAHRKLAVQELSDSRKATAIA